MYDYCLMYFTNVLNTIGSIQAGNCYLTTQSCKTKSVSLDKKQTKIFMQKCLHTNCTLIETNCFKKEMPSTIYIALCLLVFLKKTCFCIINKIELME